MLLYNKRRAHNRAILPNADTLRTFGICEPAGGVLWVVILEEAVLC